MFFFLYFVFLFGLNFRDSISFIIFGFNKMLRILGLVIIFCIFFLFFAVGWLGLVEFLIDMLAFFVGDFVYRVFDIIGFIVGGGVFLVCLIFDLEFSLIILFWGIGLLGVVVLFCLLVRLEKCLFK